MSTIVFIDPTIPDYQSLTDGLTVGTQLVLLDPTQDGILQITEALRGGSFDAVHIVSHGTSGNLQLGTAQLNSNTVDSTYSSVLQEWSNYLTPGADILLYGCNVAQGVVGQNFVQKLHQATGADIAASDNATGSVVLGGDWNLEYTTGLITTPLAFQTEALEAYNSVLAAFTAGNLVVLQAASASANNTTASILEINPTLTNQTSPVQTIAIAGTGTDAIRISGSASTTGYVSRTNDGSLLTFTGVNNTNTSSNANTLNPRAVVSLDSNGTVAIATTYTGTSGNQTRSATSLNNSTWFIADQGGIYTNNATSASPAGNFRAIKPFGGTVYVGQASASNAPVSIVTAATGGTVTGLTGLTSNNNLQDFYLIQSGDNGSIYDVLYTLSATSATAGTISKFSFIDAIGNDSILDTWQANGSYTTTFGGFGLAAQDFGNGAKLYVTTGLGATAANSVLLLADTTGYKSTINIASSPTTLFTTPSGTTLKGIDFTPVSSTSGSPKPDLTISLSDSPDPITVGNLLTYALTVSNSGSVNASNITVQYTLPNGVTFDSTTVANGFTASQSGNIVTFTGGSINAGNNAILNVKVIPTTAGTLTSGIATVDPNNTITESNENNNIAAAITTTVNAVQVGQPPTILLNTATTTDLLDANGALSPNVSGAVSGVIGNPNDPARTLGLDFTIADPDTLVGNLTVTVNSSNTSVVPNANLTLTGSGAARNLKINPVGVGNTNIVVTVSDGNNSAKYTIAYAASANNGTATTQFLTGTSDASTAIAVGGTYFLEGDDENQVLRLYDYTKSGLPVAGFDFTSSLGLTQTDSSGALREVDIEASTKVGDRIFWLGSQSNSDDGSNRPNRNRIFATDLTGTGAATTLSYVGRYDFLKQDIINWDANNLHGKGANYYGLAASAASGVGSKQASGYNIEGLEMAPNNTTAYVAFRAPEVPPGGRANALIVPVTNFTSLLSANGGTQGSAQFGAPIELDLGDRGIREIRKNANNQYVILAGPAGESGVAPNDFRLYTWDGNPSSAPQLRTATFPADFKPEGIISVPDNLTATSQIQFINDDGDAVLYNDGTASKDLSQNNFKKFRTDSITLGDLVLPPVNVINGTSGRDTLMGTSGNDIITGYQGADILTGGAGSDQFVYTSMRDGLDTITDFTTGIDTIVFTQLFQSLGLNNFNYTTATTQGYLGFSTNGNNTNVLIDQDGAGATYRPVSLITVQNVSQAQLANAANFVF